MVDSTEGTKEGSGQTETLHDKSQPNIQFAQKSPSLAWPITKDASSSGMLSRIKMVWNNWTYGFMNRILKKGSQQFQHGEHLGIDDLYEVPDEMRADVLVQRFRKLYAEKKSLPKALFSLIIPVFMPAGFWELIYLCTRLSMPISLRYLLQALEENPLQSVVDENGLYFVFTLSAATLLGVLAQNRTQYLSTKSGIIMRAALTCAIYDHALKLSPTGKLGLSSGEITNLVATDTQKLYDVVIEGHNGWSCPVCICVVTVLLVVTIGPELLVGVLVLVLFLPVVQAIVTRMLSLRRERSKLTDVRINILTSMLQGIRVTKLNHYESKVEESVNRIREQEMGLLRKELSMWGWVLTSAVCSPILAVAVSFTTYVLVDQSNILTPSRTFSALLLFSVLRFPINLASRLVGKAAQAIEASNRITNFLSRDITEHSLDASTSVHSNQGRNAILKVKNQSFVIRSTETQIEDLNVTTHSTRSRSAKNDHDSNAHEETESSMAVSTFKLQQLNFEICYGELMAVVGSVGSGKSLLLRALLGEIPSLDGEEVKINGTVGFASQQAFIINASLRENILFGSKWDEQKYERVVQACSLHYDIDRLEPAGDLTQIGERGVTLSGGQKQRVALARVVYAEPSLALLDDCFSALDANTASMVFSSLFGDGESEGVMSDCGTVLVTHAIQFLPRVDKILVMSNGLPSFIGTWKDLQTQKGERDATIASIQNYGRKDGSNSNKKRHTHRRDDLKEVDGLIMSVEERQYGLSSLKVWSKWFSAAGGLPFVVGQVLFLILDRGFYVASDWWLSIWSDSADKTTTVLGYTFAPQRDGFEAQRDFVIVYAIIIVCSVTATIIRSQWSVAGGARCAHKLFKLMTHSALRAKMSYFDTTPLGRILNRFTYDVEVLDIELSVSMVGLMISASWLISSVVVMIVIVPYMALGLLPVIVLYFYMQLYYRMSGPDLQRIDAVSRSPIQATLAEGLEGSTTIRAFRKETNFSQNFRKCVDNNSSAMMNFLAAERWLGLRIECLGALITFVISLLIVCGNSQLRIDPGKVGLVIQWAVVFTTALNFFFLRMSESEARITSIERINETSNLPQESDWKTRNTKLSPSWPERGELEFVDVSMRYRPGLPLALNGVSFKLPAGTRCGVVGRTGSGKTSLTASILRLVEIEAGQILLDGVDLGKIGLSDVRGRRNGIRIIPQDPVLFAGTLRDCLDPFQQSNDEMIFNALRAVNHAGSEDRGFSILNDRVEEGGANFSVGERQLLCLARAIIEEPRVLILDEATASVDTGTDTFIQNMLRQKFHHTTLLTIAHRLHTVMDYDKVLVLSDGRCIDFGSPSELLDNPDGAFTAFVDSTGPENAAELRKIAYSSGSGVDELE